VAWDPTPGVLGEGTLAAVDAKGSVATVNDRWTCEDRKKQLWWQLIQCCHALPA
jgi:hypothetical protein